MTDEAFTYWRVCGSFGQMLETLRDDAFVPLHYIELWTLTKLLGTSIGVLRLPSAFAGVLMPLAMGRLARVVFGRRAEVPAALLGLSSAYFAFFARNAKMYLPAWLLLTLATTSLLAFARTRRRKDWLLFAVYGSVGALTHSLVLMPLALSPLLAGVWARRRRVGTVLRTIAATLIIAAGPLLYYTTVNQWFTVSGGFSHTMAGKAAEHSNGLSWIPRWQAGRTPWNVVMQCLSSYLISTEWPEETPPLQPDTSDLKGKTLALTEAVLAVSAVIVLADGVAAAVRRGSPDRGPRAVLMTALIILPLYGFYLRSFRTFEPPWASAAALAVVVVAIIAVLRSKPSNRTIISRLARAIGWTSVAFAVLVIAWAVARIAYANAPVGTMGIRIWNSLWMPRYAAIIAVPLLVMIAGAITALPTRLVRIGALSALGFANLYMTLLPQWYETQPPWPVICRDAMATLHGGPAMAIDWGDRSSLMPGLPGPNYELIQAATLNLAPSDFRSGNEWPYQPGREVEALIDSLPVLNEQQLSQSFAKRVVLWRRRSSDAPPPAGWRIVREESFKWYLTTDWSEATTYRRIECDRVCIR